MKGERKGMLDIRFIRENIDLVRKKMEERGQDLDLDRFSDLDRGRRDILQEVEVLRSERNKVSKEIGKRKQNKEDASDLIAKMSEVSNRSRKRSQISRT